MSSLTLPYFCKVLFHLFFGRAVLMTLNRPPERLLGVPVLLIDFLSVCLHVEFLHITNKSYSICTTGVINCTNVVHHRSQQHAEQIYSKWKSTYR